MNVMTMIEELRQERDRLDEVIAGLELLALGRGRGPGRPRKGIQAVTPESSGNRKGGGQSSKGAKSAREQLSD